MNTLMTWETFKKRQVNTKQWLLTDLLILGPPLGGGYGDRLNEILNPYSLK